MADREVWWTKVNRADQPLEGPTSLETPSMQFAPAISSRSSYVYRMLHHPPWSAPSR
jgi:hypothetical protein